MTEEVKFTKSSGNVFADIGHADAELMLVKAELARQIGKVITASGWTATRAASEIGTDQPKVSKIMNGRVREFSIERLYLFLRKLDPGAQLVLAGGRSAAAPRATRSARPNQAAARRTVAKARALQTKAAAAKVRSRPRRKAKVA